MFYNYLIFSMVALSLRIFKKYIVSSGKTPMFRIQNIGVSFLKHICFELDIFWL